MASPTDIRKGKVIDYLSAPHLVLEMQHRNQGRQAGFSQVTMRNLNTGASTVAKFRTTDSVVFLTTETKELEFSYVNNYEYHFMDHETFEDFCLPEKLLEETKQFLITGKMYNVLYINDKPVEIQLPAAVEMKIVSSPEGIRGDTASSVQKPATTETGLVLQVPLFIKEGEIIRVSTDTCSYLSRA